MRLSFFYSTNQNFLAQYTVGVGWRQDNGNRSNQESKFSGHSPVKIYEGQQKIKIVRTNRQSNLRSFCQSIFSLYPHLLLVCANNQIYAVPANQFSPSAGTTLFKGPDLKKQSAGQVAESNWPN